MGKRYISNGQVIFYWKVKEFFFFFVFLFLSPFFFFFFCFFVSIGERVLQDENQHWPIVRKLFVTDSSILVVWYETMIPVCTARISPKQFLCMTCKGILVNGYFQINHLAPVSFSLWDEQCCLDLSSTVRAVF